MSGVPALLVRFLDRVALVDSQDCSEVDVILYGVDDETATGHDARLHALLRSSSAAVIAYGWQQDGHVARLAATCGTHGFVHKQLPADELVAAVEELERARRRQQDPTVPDPRRCYPGVHKAGLTRRQSEVLAMIASGRTNVEIADDLFLSVNTVKMYVRSAYRKIDVTRRSQAVLWATQHDLGPSLVDDVELGILLGREEV